ncbi:MAG: VIT1/CCC1 transporter family protein [Gammaproteobacteria bacterium]
MKRSTELTGWHEEKQSAWLYRILAEREASNPNRARLFNDLAIAAERQAVAWERRIEATDSTVPPFRPTLRAHIVAALIRRLPPAQLKSMLAAMKLRGLSIYSNANAPSSHPQPARAGAPESFHHRLERGGGLRAAIFGVNDGLISNTSLLLGLFGAGMNRAVIVLAGVAGLIAGAASMAAGEYVSMRSQREMFEYQIGLEREELEVYPEEEAAELAMIYAARGMEPTAAKQLADDTIAQPEQALDALAREELGLDPDALGSPWRAAFASFVSFALGAVLPLIPFFFATGRAALIAMLAVAAAGLVAAGLTTSLFTGRSALYSALRMLLIGAAAGAVTFFIGRAIGG